MSSEQQIMVFMSPKKEIEQINCVSFLALSLKDP